MTVPFIDLKRFEDGFVDSFAEKVRTLTANTSFVGGAEVQSLEEMLCQENQVRYAVGCANGTDALQLALRAVGVKPGDTVLIPDLTFWATFEAVVNAGGQPVTVDVSAEDLQMDYSLFVKAVEQYRPAAAVLVHLYGWASAQLNDFRTFCREKGIPLVEDGAQCYGVQVNGSPIYAGAHISTISFYPAKTFGAAGDGGAVLTDDEALAQKVRSLGNHGREQHYAHGSVGWNSRMDAFQAAYLNLSHPHFAARLASRRRIAARYHEALPEIGWKCVLPPAGIQENGYLNVTLHDPASRASVEAHLKSAGIGFGIVYPGAISDQKGAENHLKGRVGGDVARTISASVLNLPLFPYMTEEEQEEVLGQCRKAR